MNPELLAASEQALAQSPSASFWTLHKLGDALWGQRRLKQAAHWYGQAVARGGVASALTVANHLTLLDLIDPRLAVAWLDQRWPHHATAP